MDRKQLTVILTLGVLMLLLLFTQRFFDNNFKDIAMMNSNVGELKEYYTDDGRFTFSLPENWTVSEVAEAKCNISKIEFKDTNNGIMGYLEVLDKQKDITTLAQKDIDNLVLDHTKENIDNFKSSSRNGIKTNYKTTVNKGYTFVNNNYYIPLEENAQGKVTFIVREDIYKDDMKAIFDAIVDSFHS